MITLFLSPLRIASARIFGVPPENLARASFRHLAPARWLAKPVASVAAKSNHNKHIQEDIDIMKPYLTLTLFALITLFTLGVSSESQAASFKLECIVPGYPGYVIVKPELRSVLGGRVRWNPSLRAYETDRVQRGEKLRVTISANKAGELCRNGAIVGVTAANGTAFFNVVALPYVETRFGVSPNPSFDEVYLKAYTTAGYFEQRLPIGRRP